MEVLFFILMIVFAVVSSKNDKRKKAAAGKTPADRANAVKSAQVARAAKAALAAQVAQAVQAAQAASVPVETEAPAAKERPAKAQAVAPKNVKAVKLDSQSSPVFMTGPAMLDEEGCVGGSMAHTHEEGESRAEHKRHQEAARRQEAEENLAVQAAMEMREMNLHRLRRAVVMAEILDRPKALRRRA